MQTGFTKAATNPKEVVVTPENCRWSKVLVTGEVKGHECSIRDAYNAADPVSQNEDRVLQCPLCFQGSNNEFHLFIKFTIVLSARLEIMLRDWSFLESTLLDLQSRSWDKFETARVFLGQDKKLLKTDMIDRGLALDILVDKFYLEWTNMRGQVVSQSLSTQ